jgi:hypothetical protein
MNTHLIQLLLSLCVAADCRQLSYPPAPMDHTTLPLLSSVISSPSLLGVVIFFRLLRPLGSKTGTDFQPPVVYVTMFYPGGIDRLDQVLGKGLQGKPLAGY